MTRAIQLDNVIQPYAWGSKTAIPALQNRTPSGKPEAELWIGTHPIAPSCVRAEGRPTLSTWLEADPIARLGKDNLERFGGTLPFLLKYLAAEEPLSIQCHPNCEQAREGFAREEAAGVPRDARTRTYRDPNPKPELIIAREQFEALCGFLPPEEIARRLERLALPELTDLLELLRRGTQDERLQRFFRRLMTLPAEQQGALAAGAVCVARQHRGDETMRWVTRLGERYPGDIGVLSPLLLQHVKLAPGEALFLEAGALHAYLGGVGVEIMATSDNVVRGGLTSKHVDVPELLRLLRFDCSDQVPLQPEAVRHGVSVYRTPAVQFELFWLTPDARGIDMEVDGRPVTLLGLNGRLSLEQSGARSDIDAGDAVFVPADAGRVRLTGPGEAVWATIPRATA